MLAQAPGAWSARLSVLSTRHESTTFEQAQEILDTFLREKNPPLAAAIRKAAMGYQR